MTGTAAGWVSPHFSGGELDGHAKSVFGAAFSPDGKRMVELPADERVERKRPTLAAGHTLPCRRALH
jgi:hypothetical protein